MVPGQVQEHAEVPSRASTVLLPKLEWAESGRFDNTAYITVCKKLPCSEITQKPSVVALLLLPTEESILTAAKNARLQPASNSGSRRCNSAPADRSRDLQWSRQGVTRKVLSALSSPRSCRQSVALNRNENPGSVCSIFPNTLCGSRSLVDRLI